MLHILPLACISGTAAPGAEPTILSALNLPDTQPACPAGTTWKRLVDWGLNFNNDIGYEIEIYDDVNAVVEVSGLLTSAGSYVADTGVTGDDAGTGFFYDSQYTVRLIRKSDLAIVDSMQTTLESIETGAPC